MLPRSIYARLASILLLASAYGCADRVDNRTVDPTRQRLAAVARAYGVALSKGKAPTKSADLEAILKVEGDPAELMTSPRDGRPFVVRWGTRFTEPEPCVYIHEKDGANGTRFVVMTDGAIYELTDERFQKTPKTK